ncbi:IS607 family transposase [[Brevibacterium] frigoritolerans]|nr:IS607 family transposase [Peribacillus frigoritolerans]
MEKQYKPNEFASLINVSVKTLQRWDNEGILIAYRNPSNRRFYTHTQYLEYIGEFVESKNKGKVVLYTRVSSQNQQDDLKNQTEFLQGFVNAKGIIVDQVIEDVGSGLNYNRKKWNRLLEDVQKGEVSEIYITHKDRFIRFGFDWFERFLKNNGTNLIVVNNEKLSPQEELVQDLISIIHVFSCRIYGLRKYKKKLTEDKDL